MQKLKRMVSKKKHEYPSIYLRNVCPISYSLPHPTTEHRRPCHKDASSAREEGRQIGRNVSLEIEKEGLFQINAADLTLYYMPPEGVVYVSTYLKGTGLSIFSKAMSLMKPMSSYWGCRMMF